MQLRATVLRAALAAGLMLPLAACLGDGGAMGLRAGAAGDAPDAPRRISFYRGEVVVAGPPGYCIDAKSVQRRAASGFVLMASCGHLSTAPAGAVPPAVITVSILPRDPRAEMPTAAQLAAPWVEVGVAQQVDGDGIALIQVEKGGDGLLPQGDPRHWRGAMLINGHLVGLAVYGEAGAQVSGAAGQAVLVDAAEAMLEASPLRAPKAARSDPGSAEAQGAEPASPEGRTVARAARAKPGPMRSIRSFWTALKGE